MAILTIAAVRRALFTRTAACTHPIGDTRPTTVMRSPIAPRGPHICCVLRQCCFNQHCESYGYWQNARSRMKVRRRCRTGEMFPGRLNRVSDDGIKIGHRPNNQYAAGFENKIFGVWCDGTLFERKFLA